MSSLENLLTDVLSNREIKEKLFEISQNDNQSNSDDNTISKGNNDKGTEILEFLKPYLSERMAIKAELIIKLFEVISLIESLKENKNNN